MTLKPKIRSNALTVGSWLTLAHSAIAEIMADAGFDWLVIDMEHSVIDFKEAEELIRIVSLKNITPLVRLSSNDSVQIKRVMDAGAHGIIVPMINTVQDAENAINAAYYPPKGSRGVGLARAQGYGAKFNEYCDWVNEGPIIIVQIEHVDAVKNMDGILGLNGVDGFLVGPYDLSASLGIPGQFGHPLMKEAMGEIDKRVASSGKTAGIHVVEPDVAVVKEYYNKGYRFLAYSLDIRMIDCACRGAMNQIKGELI